MSGRLKNAPADPAAERAELRQLTRELHEAAQAARDAARDLRAARDAVHAHADKVLADHVNVQVDAVSAHLQKGHDIITESMEELRQHVKLLAAELAGVTTAEELITLMTRQFMEKVRDPEILGEIADQITAEITEHVAERLTAGQRMRCAH